MPPSSGPSTPRGINSDYAARRELMADLATALGPLCRDAFAGIRVRVDIAEPPLAPALGVTVLLQRPWGRHELPAVVRARLARLMGSIRDSWPVPSVPIDIHWLRPPEHAAHGFVVFVRQEAEAAAPLYPRIHVARVAWLRPTTFLRGLLATGGQ